MTVIGDSGEELGDGSEMEDESIVDIVVVGEESVESLAVDVLSWCWWCINGGTRVSSVRAPDRNDCWNCVSDEAKVDFGSKSTLYADM